MPVFPMDICGKTEVIKKLHDTQIVLGDLRTPNVMLSEGKVFLIDFD